MDRVNLVLFFTQDIAQCLDHDQYPTSFLFWVRGKVKDNSKDNDSLFFVVPRRLSATSEWSWTSLSRPLAARSSLTWTMNENFVPSTRNVWPQKLLLTLWVKNGRVMWSESVAGTISRVSPWRVSWPTAEFACYWVRGIPVTDRGGLERESTNLYGAALWMPIWVFSTWSSWKKGRRIFLDSLILQCLVAWGPKS